MRKAGAFVAFIDEPCDLIVGYHGHTVLFEIKDGAKAPSARKLTDNEQRFHDTWTGGQLHVVLSVEQALDILSSLG